MIRFPLLVSTFLFTGLISGCILLPGDAREGVVMDVLQYSVTVPPGTGVHKEKVGLGIHDVKYGKLELVNLQVWGADIGQIGAIEIDAKMTPAYSYETIASRSAGGKAISIHRTDISAAGEDLTESLHMKFKVHRNDLKEARKITFRFQLRFTYDD
jgi:hypothetical protein